MSGEVRVALNLRVYPKSKAALARIAAARTTDPAKPVTVSKVARLALAEYVAKHDPERNRRR